MHTKTEDTDGINWGRKKTWIAMEKVPGEKTVEVSVDLTAYIQAYKAYKNHLSVSPEDLELEDFLYNEYQKISQELISDVTEDEWGLWDGLLDLAIDAEPPSEATSFMDYNEEAIDEARVIRESAASSFMEDAYVEILKNAMDETILSHFESGKPAIVRLEICIDNTTNPDEITITCTDNGRGFPDRLLNKLLTPESREAYANKRGSHKSREKARDDLPLLFGGRGRGLRVLIAKIESGDDLQPNGVRKRYWDITDKSEVTFRNKDNGTGAVIQITTSKTPMQLAVEEENDFVVQCPSERAIKNQQQLKQAVKNERDISPISIDTDLSREDDSEITGSPGPHRG